MSNFRYYGTNRSLCSVFDAMRDADKTKNYSYMLGLIEEAQYYGNKMESALQDVKDIRALNEERAKLKKEVYELRKEKEQLKPTESKDE
jgi:hypothetical protein